MLTIILLILLPFDKKVAIDDFLSLSKLEEDKVVTVPAEIDVAEFINDFIDEMQPQKRPTQTIHFTYDRPVVMQVDKKLLYNILSNLIGNAIKYSGDHGQINVTMVAEHDELTIRVKDNGIGIPAEDQKHLFERFYRADNVTHIQGSGLGLNITRRYVELLEGTIEFESTPGNTVFTVSIPILEKEEVI